MDDSQGLVFVPAFAGLFAPYWRSDARGKSRGSPCDHMKEHNNWSMSRGGDGAEVTGNVHRWGFINPIAMSQALLIDRCHRARNRTDGVSYEGSYHSSGIRSYGISSGGRAEGHGARLSNHTKQSEGIPASIFICGAT